MAAGRHRRGTWRLDIPHQASLTDGLEWLATFVSDHADGFRQLNRPGTEVTALVYLGTDDRAVGLEWDSWVLARFGRHVDFEIRLSFLMALAFLALSATFLVVVLVR